MSKSDWICIGKVLKAHSLKGELFLFLFAKQADWYQGELQVGLSKELEGQPSDLHILKKLSAHKDGFIIRLEGIADRTQAELAEKKFFFIPSQILVSPSGETPFLNELLNFEVYNSQQLIGKVTDFSSNGPQDLLIVSPAPDQAPFEIPFVEAFIEQVDYVQGKIFLTLPEGLLEINLKDSAK